MKKKIQYVIGALSLLSLIAFLWGVALGCFKVEVGTQVFIGCSFALLAAFTLFESKQKDG